MKIKKTLSNWLTNRFLLIIRNEENFAEKRTFSFNYAKVIVFGITFLIIVFTLSFYLINTVLFSLLNPMHSQIETDKKIVNLSAKIDSFDVEARREAIYKGNILKVLKGDVESNNQDSLIKEANNPLKKDVSLAISPEEVNFRKKMEDEQGVVVYKSDKHKQTLANSFVKPVEGIVIQKFNPKSGFFGVDLVTKSKETVKSIADGMVIFSDFGDEAHIIAIQHKNGLISLYKYNSVLLKHSGDYVQAGDPIALTGNNSDPGKRYKLNFQLWQEGNPMNPEHFVSF